MAFGDSDSIFGKPPPGSPSEFMRYGTPTLFDVIKAIEREGQLSREQEQETTRALLRSAVQSPDLRWQSIINGLSTGSSSGVGARYPDDKEQTARVGIALGEFIGRTLQKKEDFGEI